MADQDACRVCGTPMATREAQPVAGELTVVEGRTSKNHFVRGPDSVSVTYCPTCEAIAAAVVARGGALVPTARR